MKEEDFSRELLTRWENSFDKMMNIIVKYAEEMGVEIESLPNYLMPSIVKILENESRELNLLVKEEDTVEPLF